MSGIGTNAGTAQPGLRPSQVCDTLEDHDVARLLPRGAFKLVTLLAPERLTSSRRAATLGDILSLELAVDDPQRRAILIGAVPQTKIAELENRIDLSIDELRQSDELPQPLRRALLGFFGLARTTSRPGIASQPSTAVSPDRGLFPHQKRAATAVERYLYVEGGRVMLHLPTGVGKTRTAMSIVASHLRTRSTGLVLWLATTRELLEQAASEFESTWQAVGDREVDCLRFWSNHNPPLDRARDGIVIAGLAKLYSYGRTRKRLWDLGDRTTMIVFDEAHQAVAETYHDVVETIATRNLRTPLLGLSATPGRTWADLDADAAVADLFLGNKVMVDFGGENPITHLTTKGYLAAATFSLLNVDAGLTLSADDLAEISKALDLPDELAARLGEDEQRNLRIVQRLLALTDKHSRILVFAASVDNALILTSICRGLGLKADAVTGHTDAGEREFVIRRFKRSGGPPRMLINFGVLTTGFDAPAASAALIARPTKSLVLYSQMVGRVMRGPRAGGSSHCEIVTAVDTTLPGFRDVAEAFMNWEDVWHVT